MERSRFIAVGIVTALVIAAGWLTRTSLPDAGEIQLLKAKTGHFIRTLKAQTNAISALAVLIGCAHAPKVHLATPATSYNGQEFEPPRKLRNGSGSLRDVHEWANSLLGSTYPLKTIHADIYQDGGDDLFVAQPAWGGTGG